MSELRYTSDGAMAECPKCKSLKVGAVEGIASCRDCGIQLRKPTHKEVLAEWNTRPEPSGELVGSELMPLDVKEVIANPTIQNIQKLATKIYLTMESHSADNRNHAEYCIGMCLMPLIRECIGGNLNLTTDTGKVSISREDANQIVE